MSYEDILPSAEGMQIAKAVQQQQDTQLAWITVAAAVAGGLVAAFMAVRDQKSLAQSLFSLVAGISFGIFGSPFIADKLTMTDTKSLLFIHFISGLLGAVIVDQIASHGTEIASWVMDKIMSLFSSGRTPPSPPKPTGKITKIS